MHPVHLWFIPGESNVFSLKAFIRNSGLIVEIFGGMVMKKPGRIAWFALSALVSATLACSLLLPPRPQAIPTSTPDFTMTAIIETLESLQSLATAAPTQPGAAATSGAQPQAIATATLPPPTNTLPPPPPPPTNTPLPPTPTSPPPPTFTPTVSYAGPGMRPGTSIAAAYRSSPPVIDGYLSDWDEPIYPAYFPVYGAANISEQADLWANVMVAWDTTYLYIGARVEDDEYAQNASGKYLYRGDSVEILLDTNVGGDYYLDQLSLDDYQLGISPGNPTKGSNTEAYLWFPASVEGPRTNVKIGVLPLPGGYHLELAIPWSLFGVTPYQGQHFGFAFSVSDNDTTIKNVQQAMISNVATRVLARPSTWGDLTLTP